MIFATFSDGLLMLLILGGAAIFALFTGANLKRARQKRSYALQELAAELKFDDFNPRRDEGFAMGLGFFEPARPGPGSVCL